MGLANNAEAYDVNIKRLKHDRVQDSFAAVNRRVMSTSLLVLPVSR